MNYEQRVQEALDFIEEHLVHEMTLEDVADKANFSLFYFHRIFKAYLGLSLKEYIRRRRLSESAKELVFTHKPIKTIALSYQFESQEAFTRAFSKEFEITPGKLRQTQFPFSYQRPVNLIKSKRKGVLMKPEIVIKKEFKVVGMITVSTQKNNTIPQLWDKFHKRGKEIKNAKGHNCYGICFFMEDENYSEDTPFSYMAGVEVDEFVDVPAGMETHVMKEQKYAVFTHEGALDTLHQTYRNIYSKWMDENNLEPAKADDFELYGEDFKFGEPESKMYIYVPVRG